MVTGGAASAYAYAARLAENLARSMPELAEAERARVVRAVAQAQPTSLAAMGRVDALVAHVLGLAPAPPLTRLDAPAVAAFVAELAPPEAFTPLDRRLLALAVDPAVWRWEERGVPKGAAVALGARSAALARAAPAAPRLDGLQAELTRLAVGADLVVLALRADPTAAVVQGVLTSLGRALAGPLDEARGLALSGRRGLLAVAEVWALEAPARLAAESPRLLRLAGSALAPELAGLLTALGHGRAAGVSEALAHAEAPDGCLAAARGLAAGRARVAGWLARGAGAEARAASTAGAEASAGPAARSAAGVGEEVTPGSADGAAAAVGAGVGGDVTPGSAAEPAGVAAAVSAAGGASPAAPAVDGAPGGSHGGSAPGGAGVWAGDAEAARVAQARLAGQALAAWGPRVAVGADPGEGAVAAAGLLLAATGAPTPAPAGHRRSSPCDPRSDFSWNGPTKREHIWPYATDERRSRSGCSTENEPAQRVGDFSDGLLEALCAAPLGHALRIGLAEHLAGHLAHADAARLIAGLAHRAAEGETGAARGPRVAALLARLPAPHPDALALLEHRLAPVRAAAVEGLARFAAAVAAWAPDAGLKGPGRLAVVALLTDAVEPPALELLARWARDDRSAPVRAAATAALSRTAVSAQDGLRPGRAAAPSHPAVPAEGPQVGLRTGHAEAMSHPVVPAEQAGLPFEASAAAPAPAPAPSASARPALEARLAEAQRALERPVRAWLDEAALPPLTDPEGRPLPAGAVRLLLFGAAREKGAEAPADLGLVSAVASPASAAALGAALLELFLSRGATAADKLLLPLALGLGGPKVAATLHKRLLGWPKQRRGKLADFALAALAATGEPFAQLLVDHTARRLRTTYPRQAEVARGMLANAVPPATAFGLPPGRGVVVGAGAKTLRAGVAQDGQVVLQFEEGGAPKSVPKAVAEPLRGALGRLARHAPEALAAYEAWVEDLLLTEALLPAPAWRAIFLQDMLRHVFAARQLWLAEAPGLRLAFRALADGALTGVDDAPVALPETAEVRLWHPLHAREGEAAAWAAHLARHRVALVVPQLERPVHRPTPERVASTFEPRLSGAKLELFERARAARKLGWRVEGLYAGADAGLKKAFPGLGGVLWATLHVDAAAARARELGFTDGAGRPTPLGAVPGPVYAQAVGELSRLLAGG